MKEHPKLQIYLSREEYEWLKNLANERKTSMTEIVKEALKDAKKFYNEGHSKGFDSALRAVYASFVGRPWIFYEDVTRYAKDRGMENFEPCLFTVPCSICGEPMIFTHKDNNWDEIRNCLYNAFRNWHHTTCKKQ